MSWFIMILFLGYMFENITLLILELHLMELPWWKIVLFFLFGVFIDGVRNLKAVWS